MIQFAWPWLLLLLLLPFLLPYWLPVYYQGQSTALKVPFFPHLLTLGAGQQRHHLRPLWQRMMVYVIWTLMVVAAARPVYIGPGIPLKDHARALMLAVDLSGSMAQPDMKMKGVNYTRLDVVKHVASDFIRRRSGDRLGLVLFGAQAYLRTPLTFDRDTVAQMLREAEVGMAGEQTAMGDAIGLSLKRMAHVEADEKVLVLLTDGRNNAGVLPPMKAASIAKQMGVKLYTIGLGQDQHSIRTPFGITLQVTDGGPDHDGLTKMAKMTGGQYFRAQNPEDLERVYEAIDIIEPAETEDRVYHPTIEYYPYPLGIAVLLAVIMSVLVRREQDV